MRLCASATLNNKQPLHAQNAAKPSLIIRSVGFTINFPHPPVPIHGKTKSLRTGYCPPEVRDTSTQHGEKIRLLARITANSLSNGISLCGANLVRFEMRCQS